MFAINVMSLDIYKRSVLKIKSETGKIPKKIAIKNNSGKKHPGTPVI